MSRSEVEKLVEKWRELGAAESLFKHFGRADLYRDCAHELEAAIAKDKQAAKAGQSNLK